MPSAESAWEHLPDRFALTYSELVRKSFSSTGDSVAGMGKRRGGEQPGPLGDEKALMAKRRIDRVLRKLAREAETGQRELGLKCRGCAKFIQPEWQFCAWCGVGEDQVVKDFGGKVIRTLPWTGVELR